MQIGKLINFGYDRMRMVKTYHILTVGNFSQNLKHLIYYSKYLWRNRPIYVYFFHEPKVCTDARNQGRV